MITATDRGFSVIELLAALTICGILAAIALPTWNRFSNSLALLNSARIVISELQGLRIRSAAENVSFRLAYATGAQQIAIQRDGKNWANKPLPSGISITKAGSISFSPRGTANADRVRFINRDGSCQQVVVSSTGRVRSCKAACGNDC